MKIFLLLFRAGRFLNRNATKSRGSSTTREHSEAMLSAGAHANHRNWCHCADCSEWNAEVETENVDSSGSRAFVSLKSQNTLNCDNAPLTKWCEWNMSNSKRKETSTAQKRWSGRRKNQSTKNWKSKTRILRSRHNNTLLI